MFRNTLTMLGLALLLSGCSSSGNKADSKDPTQPSSPFGMFQKKPDTKKDSPTNSSATSSNPTSKPSGVLAGQVMDRNNRRPAGVIIQVVDLQKNTTLQQYRKAKKITCVTSISCLHLYCLF